MRTGTAATSRKLTVKARFSEDRKGMFVMSPSARTREAPAGFEGVQTLVNNQLMFNHRWRIVLKVVDKAEHLFQAKGFAQDVDGTCLTSGIQKSRFTEPRHHDNLGRRTKTPDLSHALYTIYTGQLDIHKGNIVA